MKQVELHYGAATDVGLVREVNEDAFLAAPPIFVVADGMGGHDGGDVASAIVVEEFARLAGAHYDLRRGGEVLTTTLGQCQRRISEYGRHQVGTGRHGRYAGTTVVAALLVEDDDGPKWLLANLGDSRIYRLGGDVFGQVSVDHSVVQELVEAGTITVDDVATHPDRHVITRSLGGPDPSAADYFVLTLPSVERLLLCSDGVNAMIDDDAIAATLRESADPRDAAARVVAAAVAAGGRDNATAVVVDVVGSVTQNSHDSERQRTSLEQKLGALP